MARVAENLTIVTSAWWSTIRPRVDHAVLLLPQSGLGVHLVGFVVGLQLMVPAESAHGTISALGEVGLLQFKDLNADKSAFQRTFANHVRTLPFCARIVPAIL